MRGISKDTATVAGVAVAGVAYAVAVDNGAISHQAAELLSDWTVWIMPLVAGALCLFAASRHKRRMRLGWILLGASAVAWGIGDATWTFYEKVLHIEPFPSLADIGFLGAVPLAAAAILCFADEHRRSAVRTLLDAALIGGSVLLIAWVLVLKSLFAESSGHLLEQVLSLAYPSSDIVIATIVVFVWARARGASRSPLILIGAGLLALAIGDAGYALLVARDTYFSGHPIDMGWLGGYALVGLAALRARKANQPLTEGTAGLRVLLPYVLLIAAVAVTVVAVINSGSLPPFEIWGLMILVLVVVVRQFVMVSEQQGLTIERMRAIDEMKNNFLRAVSHELRTPLTFIEGAAAMIVEQGDDLSDDVRKDLMERLLKNSKRLDHLLVGLLDLGRITQGILEPDRAVTDLSELIERVASEVQDETHPIEVGRSTTLANVDQIQAERIIENLLLNAIRHTPDGTYISAEARRTSGGVLISVEDGGPGVPEEDRESIFQPFVQARLAVEAGRGTGIGLALVARFAELHGGRAWVEDGARGGAKFQVLLADHAGDPLAA